MLRFFSLAIGITLLSTTAWGQSVFDGAYVGAFVGPSPAGNNPIYHAGVLGGYRLTIGEALILGLEAQAGGYNDSGDASGYEAALLISGGVDVGGNALVFASSGLLARNPTEDAGAPLSDRRNYVLVGAGAEVAVNEIVHVRGEVHRMFETEYAADFAYRANLGLIAQF